jgi:hypothetical protein
MLQNLNWRRHLLRVFILNIDANKGYIIWDAKIISRQIILKHLERLALIPFPRSLILSCHHGQLY